MILPNGSPIVKFTRPLHIKTFIPILICGIIPKMVQLKYDLVVHPGGNPDNIRDEIHRGGQTDC